MRFVGRGFDYLLIQNPLLLVFLLFLLAIAGVVWYREQVQETNEAEKRRKAERGARDSIFRDLD